MWNRRGEMVGGENLNFGNGRYGKDYRKKKNIVISDNKTKKKIVLTSH